jgi:TetR/AcrR family acrAB operon transcriptional repressor
VEYVDELLAVRDRRVECRNECLAECERVLREAARRGQVDARRPVGALALGLHALVDGLIQNWMLRPSAFDLVRVGRQAVRAYIDGLRPAARQPREAAAARRARERLAQA